MNILSSTYTDLANLLHIDLVIDEAAQDSWSDQSDGIIRNALLATVAYIEDFINIYGKSDVAIFLTDDKGIQDLNYTWRGKNYPTNVLSFPVDMPTLPDNSAVPTSLGDIALSAETLQREACLQNKSYHDHLTHLVIHGFLHLLTYDHETEEEALIMETLETDILATLSIADPYSDIKFDLAEKSQVPSQGAH